jgi:hypothetical protein
MLYRLVALGEARGHEGFDVGDVAWDCSDRHVASHIITGVGPLLGTGRLARSMRRLVRLTWHDQSCDRESTSWFIGADRSQQAPATNSLRARQAVADRLLGSLSTRSSRFVQEVGRKPKWSGLDRLGSVQFPKWRRSAGDPAAVRVIVGGVQFYSVKADGKPCR